VSTESGSEAPYLDPYRKAVARGGSRFESLLWCNREFQRTRFETIADMVDLTGRVVADMGAGRADFLDWLEEHHVACGGFVGVEAVAEHIEYARARPRRTPSVEFVQADFAAPGLFASLARAHGVHVFVFSGSLNTFDEAHAREVLEQAWLTVRETWRGALVFNFLSDRYRRPAGEALATGPAKRFSTIAMLDWALSRTTEVRFRHDYLGGHDATIAMLGSR